MDADSFTCDRCGGIVTKQLRQETTSGMVTGAEYAECPGCRTRFDEVQIDSIQTNELDNVATADTYRPGKMLGRDDQWVRRELNNDALAGSFPLAFPLAAIQACAEKHNISLTPLPEGQAVWVPKKS